MPWPIAATISSRTERRHQRPKVLAKRAHRPISVTSSTTTTSVRPHSGVPSNSASTQACSPRKKAGSRAGSWTASLTAMSNAGQTTNEKASRVSRVQPTTARRVCGRDRRFMPASMPAPTDNPAMTQLYAVHPTNPQPRLLRQAAQILHQGGIAAIPTDSSYALVCHLDDKAAVQALRRIRGIDERHHLTLLCRDLSELATYARVDDRRYRLLKLGTPGPYTFILEATKEVPRRLSHPSRRTIGLRVPDHRVAQALLEQFGQPLLATTLIPPGESEPMNDAQAIGERYDRLLHAVVDAGACPMQPTTVIDLSGEPPLVLRRGCATVGPIFSTPAGCGARAAGAPAARRGRAPRRARAVRSRSRGVRPGTPSGARASCSAS